MAVTRVIVAYDVHDDDRRARLAAHLSKVGVRLQRSVFECILDADTLQATMQTVEAIVDLRTDVVHGFRQCAACQDEVVRIGQASEGLDIEYWIV